MYLFYFFFLFGGGDGYIRSIKEIYFSMFDQSENPFIIFIFPEFAVYRILKYKKRLYWDKIRYSR